MEILNFKNSFYEMVVTSPDVDTSSLSYDEIIILYNAEYCVQYDEDLTKEESILLPKILKKIGLKEVKAGDSFDFNLEITTSQEAIDKGLEIDIPFFVGKKKLTHNPDMAGQFPDQVQLYFAFKVDVEEVFYKILEQIKKNSKKLSEY